MSMSRLAFLLLFGLAASQTVDQQLQGVKNVMKSLSRQLMMQQLFVEESIRSNGDSGLKISRLGSTGTRPYHGNTISGRRVASVHDHSNNIRTVGMGEFIAVLNGVEFRTRHNDYRLKMPHRTAKTFKATEDIPLPGVPAAVSNKPSADEQMAEMREWFKAWRDQDYSKRDYRKFFKPVLCYLEGAWTKNNGGKIDEPFFSDRHFIDAKSWYDLQDKIRFTSYTGRKSQLENFAFLPTTVMNLDKDGVPEIAQWTYRILCHPLKQDVSTKQFRLIDDILPRAMYKQPYENLMKSRAARFQLDPNGRAWKKGDGVVNYALLDKLMEEVPGMDNYAANLKDDAGGIEATTLAEQPLNAGYYHRVYKVLKKDAMGIQTRRRGFSDGALFAAMNSQERVAGMSMEYCAGKGRARKCGLATQKWSYAIPLEIIYLTPLYTWNPRNVPYRGDYRSKGGLQVRANGATGRQDKPYDGINSKIYYMTPSEFFAGKDTKKDKADTARGSIFVLDNQKKAHAMKASGTRIVLPNIAGVGALRTRYPIMPLHHDGNTVMKAVSVIEDMLTQPSKMSFMFREKFGVNMQQTKSNPDVTLELGDAQRDPPGPHTHLIDVPASDVKDMIVSGKTLEVYTDQRAGHNHKLQIRYNRAAQPPFEIVKCDNGPPSCWDDHGKSLTITN